MSTALAVSCAICLGVEMLISLVRHTTRAATVGKKYGSLLELRVESISTSSNGMAYWVQGRPVPVLEATGREDVLLASTLHDIVSAVPVIVEGPFGPNIGIASWIYRRLIKEQKRQHPMQVPTVDKLCLVADSTGFCRSLSLWAWYAASFPLLITSTTPEVLKEYFGENKVIGEAADPHELEKRVRHYSSDSRLILICGKPKFQSQVEEWAASALTINR